MLTAIPIGDIAPKTSGYGPTTNISLVISNILGIITLFSGLAFIFYLMFGAINWITSAGDANKAKAASATITNALIGLVITVMAYPIILLLSQVLGIPLANPAEILPQLLK